MVSFFCKSQFSFCSSPKQGLKRATKKGGLCRPFFKRKVEADSLFFPVPPIEPAETEKGEWPDDECKVGDLDHERATKDIDVYRRFVAPGCHETSKECASVTTRQGIRQ